MTANGYCVLNQRTLFRLEGGDRVRYLNGQVSNDVTKSTTTSAIQACVLTAKGKLCAVIWIWATQDGLFIEAAPSLRESLQARLERYIIADDVTLIHDSDRLHLIHVLNPEFSEGIDVSRFGSPGKDLWVAPGDVAKTVEKLEEQGLKALSPELRELCRISNGVPYWEAELDENTLPQEARLENTAVDFHKGCYVGQEVVSRIKSVGRVNRRLTGFEAESPLAAGMILAAEANPETPLGAITSVSPVFGLSKWIGMGYVKHGFDISDARLLAIDPQKGSPTSVRVREFPIDIVI
ncbi:MAG: hypothetical protein ABI615_02980 [Chthoniobacterales bacterium]